MTPAEYPSDEVADAGRDAVALLRASIEGRHADVDAIFDAAADGDPVTALRKMHQIAATLLGMSSEMLVRLTAAVASIEDERKRELVTAADLSVFLAEPEIRQAVSANLAQVQARIIEDS